MNVIKKNPVVRARRMARSRRYLNSHRAVECWVFEPNTPVCASNKGVVPRCQIRGMGYDGNWLPNDPGDQAQSEYTVDGQSRSYRTNDSAVESRQTGPRRGGIAVVHTLQSRRGRGYHV